jgi:hypothetical protein
MRDPSALPFKVPVHDTGKHQRPRVAGIRRERKKEKMKKKKKEKKIMIIIWTSHVALMLSRRQ